MQGNFIDMVGINGKLSNTILYNWNGNDDLMKFCVKVRLNIIPTNFSSFQCNKRGTPLMKYIYFLDLGELDLTFYFGIDFFYGINITREGLQIIAWVMCGSSYPLSANPRSTKPRLCIWVGQIT